MTPEHRVRIRDPIHGTIGITEEEKTVIDSRFFRVVDYPTAAALSFTLMAAILVLVLVYIRRAGTEELV